jgi:uncharacterized protein (TIGR02001 family)
LLLPAALLPSPAFAQISGELTIASNEIFRGETITDDDPVAKAEVSIDHASGLFAGASVSLSGGRHDPRVIANTQYGGFSRRSGETSLEIGVIHRHYQAGSMFDEAYRNDYVEAYAGIARRNLRMRVYVSPNYLKDGRTSYYGEVNGRMLRSGKWSLQGHVGLSVVPPDPGNTAMRYYYDWSVQASRPIGRINVSLGVAGTNYPVFSESKGVGFFSNRPKAFLSISHAF